MSINRIDWQTEGHYTVGRCMAAIDNEWNKADAKKTVRSEIWSIVDRFKKHDEDCLMYIDELESDLDAYENNNRGD
jgi:hypothetical protein